MGDYVSVIEESQCAFIIGISLDLSKHAWLQVSSPVCSPEDSENKVFVSFKLPIW